MADGQGIISGGVRSYPRRTVISRRAVHHDFISEQANLSVALNIDGAPSSAEPMEGRPSFV